MMVRLTTRDGQAIHVNPACVTSIESLEGLPGAPGDVASIVYVLQAPRYEVMESADTIRAALEAAAPSRAAAIGKGDSLFVEVAAPLSLSDQDRLQEQLREALAGSIKAVYILPFGIGIAGVIREKEGVV